MDFRTTNRPFLQNTVPVVQGFPVGEGRGLVSPDFGIGQAEAFLIVRRAIVVLSREKKDILRGGHDLQHAFFRAVFFRENFFHIFGAAGKSYPQKATRIHQSFQMPASVASGRKSSLTVRFSPVN